MSVQKFPGYLFLLFFVHVMAFAQIDDARSIAEKITRTALKEQHGYLWLKELCAIGPRLNGSQNSYQAIEWAEQKMKSLNFPKVWLQPVMVPHWVRGHTEIAQIVSTNRRLNITALGRSIGTPAEGITANILEVNSFQELQDNKELAAGKIIFFNQPFDHSFVNTFAGYGDAVKQRSEGAIEAAKAGGVAALVRSVTSKNDNNPHTGGMRYDEKITKIPSAAIGVQDVNFLSAELKKNPELQIFLLLSSQILPDTLSYNVIGEIPGTERPEEIILLGGHFDSWDKGQGTHDDGAGCLQALEAFDLLNRIGIKPKRTIRVVFFSDEELRQSGAKAYAVISDSLKLNHIAAIESDRGAFTPRGFSVDSDSSTIERMQAWLPILQESRIEWIRSGGSGVDVSRLKSAKARIGYVPDDQRYFDFHHSDNDIFESVNPREFELGSAAMAILAYLISEEGL